MPCLTISPLFAIWVSRAGDGLLDEEGNVDVPRMRNGGGKGMAVTFHRALDMCKTHCKPLIPFAELGVARVLTSGQQSSAEKDCTITELKAHSGVPIIMAGAGVRASNLELF